MKQKPRLTKAQRKAKFKSVRKWLESKRKEEAIALNDEFNGEKDN